MNIKPYNVRRLFLEHEVNSIFALHASAKEFQSHYPNYDAWLNKSLREVLQGKRVAFGLFLSGFDDTLKHNSTMVGSVILKPDSYARTTELKNIYIAENHRNSSYGTALLEKVCSYCSEVASTVLETEVPCDLTKTVGFFHKNGFHVNSMRRSPYVQTQYQYRMEKLFPPC
jgi:ribosomal protein S18 acetylase RimI-like enzyme